MLDLKGRTDRPSNQKQAETDKNGIFRVKNGKFSSK